MVEEPLLLNWLILAEGMIYCAFVPRPKSRPQADENHSETQTAYLEIVSPSRTIWILTNPSDGKRPGRYQNLQEL